MDWVDAHNPEWQRKLREEANVAEEVRDVEIRPYRFEVVVTASSLDDALRALRLAGFDVDDLTKVRWVD